MLRCVVRMDCVACLSGAASVRFPEAAADDARCVSWGCDRGAIRDGADLLGAIRDGADLLGAGLGGRIRR
jgi:hypothetical protein